MWQKYKNILTNSLCRFQNSILDIALNKAGAEPLYPFGRINFFWFTKSRKNNIPEKSGQAPENTKTPCLMVCFFLT